MKTIEGYTYKVGEHIGKGYSSTVHKGLKDRTGEEVSIKVIQMAKLEDPINQMLLQMEVSALKALAGRPHILHLLDVYATRNNTYLVTELCEGDLNTALRQRRTLPYFEAVEVMRQLIEGYHDIHQAGYVHRDIKPANILHKNGIYKFADFGFTVPIAELGKHRHYNVGSPVYMPPEALKDNQFSVSCDIWALGIIFFQLLKGNVPWRALAENVLYEKIRCESINSLTCGTPQPAQHFFSLVLNLDPKLRPSPEELLNWPGQLQSANIEMRHLSPMGGRRQNPLREVSDNTPAAVANTLKRTQNENQYLLGSKGVQNQGEGKQEEFKEVYFFANNWISYLKFLHRILKFLQISQPLDLSDLVNSITRYLFKELEQLKKAVQLPSEQPPLPGWAQFIQSSKGEMIGKKIKKCENKYRMFHSQIQGPQDLNGSDILEGVGKIMDELESSGFVGRLVVGADYLITLYQLLHLREKYEGNEFMKMSKIDLIMQGNPYSTTPQHFQKLKKKLMIIQP